MEKSQSPDSVFCYARNRVCNTVNIDEAYLTDLLLRPIPRRKGGGGIFSIETPVSRSEETVSVNR